MSTFRQRHHSSTTSLVNDITLKTPPAMNDSSPRTPVPKRLDEASSSTLNGRRKPFTPPVIREDAALTEATAERTFMFSSGGS
jgi:hypothetical protein